MLPANAIVCNEVVCAWDLSILQFVYILSVYPEAVCTTGVGEYYTDPQIHTVTGEGYGEGNLGAAPLTVATCVVCVSQCLHGLHYLSF